MICDMLLSEPVQIDGNVVDIPGSLNLQRVYETIELSDLECMTQDTKRSICRRLFSSKCL